MFCVLPHPTKALKDELEIVKTALEESRVSETLLRQVEILKFSSVMAMAIYHSADS